MSWRVLHRAGRARAVTRQTVHAEQSGDGEQTEAPQHTTC